MVDLINTEIAAEITARTAYGIRVEKVVKNGYILTWFNGSMSWLINYGCIRKGTVIRLDANQIFVSSSKSQISQVLDRLPPLPLYRNAYEYREEF